MVTRAQRSPRATFQDGETHSSLGVRDAITCDSGHGERRARCSCWARSPVDRAVVRRSSVGTCPRSNRQASGQPDRRRDSMSTHYALVSHGKVLGYTGALFPSDELPMGARVWHFVPLPAFDYVEPIIAELTAAPAIE